MSAEPCRCNFNSKSGLFWQYLAMFLFLINTAWRRHHCRFGLFLSQTCNRLVSQSAKNIVKHLSDRKSNPLDSCVPVLCVFHLRCPFILQIDHALFQQTLQQGGLLSQPLSVDTSLVSHSGSQLMSTTDPSVPANVVIHPLTSLALQPSSITPAQVSMAGLSEQDSASMRQLRGDLKILNGWMQSVFYSYVCLSVGCAGSQDLSHVMSSSGLVAGGGSSGQEITLTINNSSLTQALAQAQASAAGSSSAAGNPQEITLTISGRMQARQAFIHARGPQNDSHNSNKQQR